jgi:predicted nuclease of predicted toxin-antitoxin system
MVRFLADADFNYAIVKGCRRRELTLDFLSANEARLRGVADPEVLAFAAEQNRILVTHDFQTIPPHFDEFLMRRQSSPGVFLVSQYAAIGDVIDELVLIWAACRGVEKPDREDSAVLTKPRRVAPRPFECTRASNRAGRFRACSLLLA